MSGSDTEHKAAIADKLFRQYGVEGKGELSAIQLQSLHETIRMGGVSLAQVKASMEYCCLLGDCCEPSELFDLLQEMDRRYFLVQDLRWEFALLDREQQDLISETEARFLFEVVHGNLFSLRRWEKFLKSRPVPGTGVSFAEIEVDLCNIPSREEIALEQLEEQREKEERERIGGRPSAPPAQRPTICTTGTWARARQAPCRISCSMAKPGCGKQKQEVCSNILLIASAVLFSTTWAGSVNLSMCCCICCLHCSTVQSGLKYFQSRTKKSSDWKGRSVSILEVLFPSPPDLLAVFSAACAKRMK